MKKPNYEELYKRELVLERRTLDLYTGELKSHLYTIKIFKEFNKKMFITYILLNAMWLVLGIFWGMNLYRWLG